MQPHLPPTQYTYYSTLQTVVPQHIYSTSNCVQHLPLAELSSSAVTCRWSVCVYMTCQQFYLIVILPKPFQGLHKSSTLTSNLLLVGADFVFSGLVMISDSVKPDNNHYIFMVVEKDTWRPLTDSINEGTHPPRFNRRGCTSSPIRSSHIQSTDSSCTQKKFSKKQLSKSLDMFHLYLVLWLVANSMLLINISVCDTECCQTLLPWMFLQ